MITYTHTHTCMYRYKVPYIPYYNRYNNFNIIIKILNWIFLSNTSFFSILPHTNMPPYYHLIPPFCLSQTRRRLYNFPLLLPNERNIDI